MVHGHVIEDKTTGVYFLYVRQQTSGGATVGPARVYVTDGQLTIIAKADQTVEDLLSRRQPAPAYRKIRGVDLPPNAVKALRARPLHWMTERHVVGWLESVLHE